MSDFQFPMSGNWNCVCFTVALHRLPSSTSIDSFGVVSSLRSDCGGRCLSMVKSAVRVVVRTRPCHAFAQDVFEFQGDGRSVSVTLKRRAEQGVVNNQQEHLNFAFDSVLHNVGQETIFDDVCKDTVSSVLQGYNGTILCYGQTGAGKTFTMSGGSLTYQHRGIIPRTISHIFRTIGERPETAATVRVSYLELYNESAYDVLDPTSQEELTMVDMKGGTHVRGLSCHIANNEEEALNLFFEGETSRAIGEHQLNKTSSRSHCLFTIYVEQRSRVESDERVLQSKLNLVDLAGSERVKKTQSTGIILEEAKYINKSLTYLEQVVLALTDRHREHIPFRQSRLTNVLKDSLGGNCRTLLIANIWPETTHVEETISTLRFAQRMMRVKNDAVVNVQQDPALLIKKYEKEIKELKQELAMHDTLANRGRVTYEPYTEEERYELAKEARQFLSSELSEIDIVNLRQVRELFVQFRILYANLSAEIEENLRAKFEMTVKSDDNTTASAKPCGSLEDSATGEGGCVGEVEGDGGGFGVGKAFLAAPSIAKPKKCVRSSGGVHSSQNASAAEQAEENEVPRTPPKPRSPGPGSAALDKNDAFEQFKQGMGAEMFETLEQNQIQLKEKRRLAREQALHVNETKRQIDALKEKLHEKALTREENGDGLDIIDEEEFQWIQEVKEAKLVYRENFDVMKTTKKEIEYLSRLVEQCRHRLASEFEEQYASLHGTRLASPDLLDDGEQFDKLEMERIMAEDPDACAFYSAVKNAGLTRKGVRHNRPRDRAIRVFPPAT